MKKVMEKLEAKLGGGQGGPMPGGGAGRGFPSGGPPPGGMGQGPPPSSSSTSNNDMGLD